MSDASHQNLPPTDAAVLAWTRAVTKLHEADQRFIPASKAFSNAEGAFFRLRARKEAGELNNEDYEAAYSAIGLEEATKLEHTLGEVMFAAARACFLTPAPHLAALIEKLELIEQYGFDGEIEPLILSDLRRLNEYRSAADGG